MSASVTQISSTASFRSKAGEVFEETVFNKPDKEQDDAETLYFPNTWSRWRWVHLYVTLTPHKIDSLNA